MQQEMDIPTPALVIDDQVVENNLQRMARYTSKHGLRLRPHSKTHKSLRMTRRQLEWGATGITVAKLGEAGVMVQADCELLIAYPVLDQARLTKLEELTKVAGDHTILVTLDSATAAPALASAARASGREVGVLIDIDVGHHRTGVTSPEDALALAQQVDRENGLRLEGLMCYPGHIHGTLEQQTPVLHDVQIQLEAILDLWKRKGLEARIVSGGSTPTAYHSHLIPALTEIRPGTYIYNDRKILSGGYCRLEDCAAHFVCTVVSNTIKGKVVIDGGGKTFSYDPLGADDGGGGYGLINGFPEARVIRLSEEHGEVDVSACPQPPKLGQRLHIIPNHVCPTVNLQDSAWLRLGGGKVEPLPIDTRGLLC